MNKQTIETRKLGTVLDKKRLGMIKQLDFLDRYNFYLAGGTGLAMQIYHRTSLDFDFYCRDKFDAFVLRKEFEERFVRVIETQIAEDTLLLEVDGVQASFFKYDYPLIRKAKKVGGIDVASIEDIAAMKIIAITQRGKRRDFIDIYFLMKTLGLKQILELTVEKYPMFNVYVGLQGLIYFADAEKNTEYEQTRFVLVKGKNPSWGEMKEYITAEVKLIRKGQ